MNIISFLQMMNDCQFSVIVFLLFFVIFLIFIRTSSDNIEVLFWCVLGLIALLFLVLINNPPLVYKLVEIDSIQSKIMKNLISN